MITQFIITAAFNMIKAIFSILPSLPAIPTAISDGGAWVIATVQSVVGFLSVIYSPALLAAMVVVVIGIFSWEQIYHTAMWIIRKIPMINIK